MPEFQGWLKKSPKYMDKAFCGLCQSELSGLERLNHGGFWVKIKV